MPGVSLKGLTRRYGDVAAVKDLSLEVKPGELVALLGPSGCGKTTTLRLVAGFLAPEAGEIWVGDRCLSSSATVVPPERRRMAMIFQSYALWPHMTVAQNVGYGLRFKRSLAGAERDRKVTEMLRVVQLGGLRGALSRASSAAASSSGWRWRGRWWSSRRSCCSTSRSPTWTPTCARRCASRSGACTRPSASRPSTSPTTRPRPWSSPTASRCWTAGASPRSAPPTRSSCGRARASWRSSSARRTSWRAWPSAADTIAVGPLRLRVASAGLVSGARVAVSIRPHDIALASPGNGATGANALRGTVQRASFLGDSVDCQVRVAESDVVLRVAAPAAHRVRPGEAVGLSIDPAACVPLAATEE